MEWVIRLPLQLIMHQTIKFRWNGSIWKVLRKIFDPTKERDGTWRIKTND